MMSSHTPPPTLPAFLDRWQTAGGAERSNAQLFITELCDLLNLPHPTPAVADPSKNTYVFEHTIKVPQPDGSPTTNFIDLYKRHHFVLESKQGIEKSDAVTVAGTLRVPSPPTAATTLPMPSQPTSAPATSPSLGIQSLGPRPPSQKHLKKGHGIRHSKLWDDALLRAKAQAEAYVRNIPDDNPPFLLVLDIGYSFETYADFSGLGKTYTPFPDTSPTAFPSSRLEMRSFYKSIGGSLSRWAASLRATYAKIS
jgi:hypothetical protein